MEDLSLHMLDITQNAIRAGATEVAIEVVEDRAANVASFVIRDNGCGMTEEQLSRLHDPFFTTRTTRRVGLGVPLLKQTAEQAGGGLRVTSAPGAGTTVEARFQYDHPDRPPLGDVVATFWTLVVTNPRVEFTFRHERDGAYYDVSTAALKRFLRVPKLGTPRLARAFKQYLQTREELLAQAAGRQAGRVDDELRGPA